MNLLNALWRNRLANTLVKTLRVNRLVDAGLSRWPLKRRTSTGQVYELDSVPSLLVANEIFASDIYRKPVSTIRPGTFLDLGANVGYFPILVAEVAGSREVRGLSIEPNPRLVPRIESHLAANRLEHVHCVHGVAAGDQSGAEADFYLNPSHIASSMSGRFNPRTPVAGKVEKIRVPVVDIDREWRRHFGDERVDLLKVDIEGAEVPFLRAHAVFLEKVDAILIEWHAWVTTLAEVSGVLEPMGFALADPGEDGPDGGLALFRRGG